MEFETERLRVRPWSSAHSSEALAAVLTPAVLAPLPPPLQKMDPEAWIAERLAESDVYAVEAEGRLIGVMLLAPLEVPHLGYLLAEHAWGKGYATELVRGVAAAIPGGALRAGVARDNPASIRVLEKAGFTPCDAGPERLMFELTRP
ncbi:GNAT family N-acetyltransferase [Gymnodinialimonas sp.]